MKNKLLLFVLGAALVGGSTAALAEPGRGPGHNRPHAEQRQERQWDRNHWSKGRDQVKPHRYSRSDRHGPRWAKGRGHGQRWSHHQHHGHYAKRPARYTPYYGRGRHLPRHAPRNGVSIILHGHF